MKRPMIVMLLVLAILFGGIYAYKTFMHMMMMKFFATQGNPVVTVSTTKASAMIWQTQLTAVGNVRAVKGVNVTTSLAGMVKQILFKPGANVTAGDLLVQLDADVELAQLHSLEANANLAELTYQRDKAQFAAHVISKAVLEADTANLKSLTAQVTQQRAIVEKKSIRAPFSGRSGISRINIGQYLNPGDVITSLQTLNPIYVDFYIPQQQIAQLKIGQVVQIQTDAFPNKTFNGRLTTINPVLDSTTRNVEVEATIDNIDEKLTPGMFVAVNVLTGDQKRLLTLPQSAISFNSYGDIVYLVVKPAEKPTEKADNSNQQKTQLIAKQTFVTTGETRGDQIAVLQGIREGDVVVTSGQLKLRNNSPVSIDNTIQPSASISPNVPNEHGR